MTDPNQPPPNQPPPDPYQQQPYQQQPNQPPPYQQQQPNQPPPYQQQQPSQPPPSFQKPDQPQAYGYPAAPPPPAPGGSIGPGGTIFDQRSGLYLPPGTELASSGRRIGAYFLAIPLMIITLFIGYLIWGLILWGKGTTPALKVLGMKVYRVDNGTVPGFGRMALREILGRIVDQILSVITLLTSFIMMLAGAKKQTLHDIVASTVVLYDPNKVLG